MKSLFGIFHKRRVVAVLGLLALALLIWFLGPLLALAGYEPLASPWSRGILIAILVVAWGVKLLLAHLKATRTNEAMLKEMAGAPGAAAESAAERQSKEEVAELHARFEEATAVLKRARLGKEEGGQYLYQLPWYIIIGPPGSGKTTALVNSGLHFPLGDRFGAENKVRGVGGTRNCDWWFTDEAVLLDTAGRYTTQDSQAEVDRSAWLGFLALLKKHRRRRPVNGALVAVSVADLLQQTETETAAHIRAIKQRIQELHQELGVRFPIYVLFTKCDLIAGFVEFFDDLGQEGRTQVWGETFPADTIDRTEAAVGRFVEGFDALERRLQERLVERLQAERDLRRRDLIYAFPRQFASLRQVAERFVTEIFQPSRFETAPILRGVYFTSGTQEGAPIDRLMGALAGAFALPRESLARFSGAGRSYFLTRLFREVVFREAGLAGTDLRAQRRQAWLQRGAYAGAAALTLLVGAGWLTSYYRNLGYVETVSQAAKQAQASLEGLAPGEQDFSRILPALNTVRDLPGGYGEQDASVPILSRLGLYQGDKLGSQARAAYFRALGDAFLPAIMLRMEDQLRRGQTNLEFLYETLKAYLMLGDRAHYDPETVKAWVLLNWQQSLPRQFTNEQREALEGHLGAMLAHLPDPLPLPLDTDLIARTRAAVARVPLATRVYGRLKLGQYGRLAPEFRVADAAGRDAAVTFVRKSGEPLTRGVPGLYTLAGYRQVFQKQTPLVAADLLRETWVVGGEQASELTPERLTQLATEVRELYFKDYVAQWQGLLTDLDLVGLTSARQAVEVLGVLSGKDSPLKRLLVAVATQTTLGEEPQAEAAAQQAAGDALSAVKDRLARFLQTQPTAPGKPSEPPPASLVDERFADLHRLVRSEGGSPAPIDAVLAALDELFVQLNAFAGALDRGAKALDAASGGGGPGAAIGKLKLQAKRQPPPVNGWLEAVASNSASLTLGDARGHVRDAWAAEVLPFCRRATASRYPFVRGTTQDVTLDDFARLFGPGGLLDAFFQKYLSPFVETAASTWQWRPVGDSSLGSSPQVLREFQRAAEIKEAFFGAGATPSVKFQLRPISMDSSIERFALDLDGQQVSYSHGPARPTALVWPGPGGAGQVTIEMSPPAATGRSAQTLIGPWAWFRLLDDASIEPTSQPEEFRVTFDLGGRKAVYALTASSVQNPFRLPALRAFRCPEKL